VLASQTGRDMLGRHGVYAAKEMEMEEVEGVQEQVFGEGEG
jgi:hypothetical protein